MKQNDIVRVIGDETQTPCRVISVLSPEPIMPCESAVIEHPRMYWHGSEYYDTWRRLPVTLLLPIDDRAD